MTEREKIAALYVRMLDEKVVPRALSGQQPPTAEEAGLIVADFFIAAGLTLSPEGGRPGLYDKPSPLIQHMDSCWHCRHSGTYCAAGLRLLNTQATDSAPRPELGAGPTPVLGQLYRPTATRGLFEDAIADASGGKVKPYDLRRTFAVWLELAGVSVTHVRLYLGHKAQTVTDRYLWREVMEHLPEDGKRVRAWLANQRKGVRSA